MGSKLRFGKNATGDVEFVESLKGHHAENAIVEIKSSSPEGSLQLLAPLVMPYHVSQNISLFVKHGSEFLAPWRKTMATFFVAKMSNMTMMGNVTLQSFTQEVQTLAAVQLNATIELLAPTLPIYQAVYPVSSHGQVSLAPSFQAPGRTFVRLIASTCQVVFLWQLLL